MTLRRLVVEPNEGTTRYTSTLLLEGRRYEFTAYTAKIRGPHWCFDLADADGRLIVTGDTLAVGVDLVGRYRYREVPPGILFVGRTDGAGRDPRPGEFLDGLAELYYLTSDDPLIGAGVPS